MMTTSLKYGNIQFGISSYAFSWAIGVKGSLPEKPMSGMELLAQAQRLSAQRLQIADNLAVHEMAVSQWKKLILTADQYNIQLELGIRGLKAERLKKYLGFAQACKSPFLRVVMDDTNYEPSISRIISIINEVLPAFKAAGIALAIENHDRFRAKDLVSIIESTDPQWVGICLDTANSIAADEGIYELARILAPYTINLHVKDYIIQRLDHQMGFKVLGRPAGQGQAPIKWLLDILKPYQRCQSATLELWSSPMQNIEATIKRERSWVDIGASYLRTLLQTTIK